ncbi:MAG TPA: glutamine-hydrolyzing GMP synthase [Candidatus Nanoarchaeia archaeon]|nr:glutamine-hydrolyzing GMP synthase [Candidatus Nanoarchaeia archaeon]
MILILNFGGQYCHLICRRIRDLGISAEILPSNASVDEIISKNPKGIIFSGGPASVYEPNAPSCNKEILHLGIPILGICYGLQLIAKLSSGLVKQKKREYGKNTLEIKNHGTLLKGLKKREQVWMSHGDSVISLPKDFHILASTPNCFIASFENPRAKLYGVQFHPEVTHTPHGIRILRNFALDICRSKRDWNIKNLDKILIGQIKSTVGEDSVLMATSGGVDSTVASVLFHKAIGDRLFCVFVDHGLIRKNELEDVKRIYSRFRFKHFICVDASETFLQRLKGISDPEKKRAIIGKTFIDVFEKKAGEIEKKHPRIKFLGQGTIYPDRIESAQPTAQASKIKSHHNITLPEKMKLNVIEPLKELYKDEVRKLGKSLGIPDEILNRHPFPGPGLAIRILGDVTEERVEIARNADYIFIQELQNAGLYSKIWQAFAALVPVKTVGVMGDARTYEYIIALRAVTSRDAMTADWAKIPNGVLEKISSRIINEVRGVNRVLYDISQKPPATIEYE